MYILMDMEWYDCNDVQFATQLAAMRVDDDLNRVDTYFSRIKPSTIITDFTSIVFNGGTEDAFQTAPSLDSVLHQLITWIKDDDILLWWHESGADFFKTLCENNNLKCPSLGVIHYIVQNKLNATNKSSNPYRIAKSLSLQIPSPEHYSPNDVEVLKELLLATGIFPNDLIKSGCYEWTPYVKPISKHKAIFGIDPLFKYYCDRTTGLIHKINCKYLTHNKFQIQGFNTFKGCIRKNFIPCKCCSEDAIQYVISLRQDGLHLFGSINSKKKLVHFSNCAILKKTKFANLEEFSSIGEALESGYSICPNCNPILVLYSKEKNEIVKLCSENRLNLMFKEDVAYIISRYDSWKIMLDDKSGKLVLLHRNAATRGRYKGSSLLLSYHLQNNESPTLIGHLNYIVGHDAYRDRLLAKIDAQSC